MLPAEIADNYRSFVGAFTEAARIGQTGEDTSRGYALASNPTARSYQEKFVSLANGNYGRLHETIRESSDPEQRAIAAYIIGYAQPTRPVVDDLQYAMQDSDESVRANATRALASIATFALKNPDSNIRVEPTWFIEMLNSIVWSDRYHAATALVSITEGRDPGVWISCATAPYHRSRDGPLEDPAACVAGFSACRKGRRCPGSTDSSGLEPRRPRVHPPARSRATETSCLNLRWDFRIPDLLGRR